MLRRILNFTACFALAVLFSLQLKAGDPLVDFTKAKEYYLKQDFDNAVKLYESMVKAGHVSAEVYYNLGNCYYKTGNTAQALLNYERAKKLSPDDEDINFNIKVASLKVVDKMDAVPEIFYKRWIKYIASLFPTDVWTKIFIANAWLFFLCLGMFVVARSSSLKKLGFILTVVFIISALSTFLLSQKSYAMTYLDQQAIITAPSVYVKNSPDEKGSDQFIIHEGTKVEVLDELGDWKKIRIANGSIGWLKQGEIEII